MDLGVLITTINKYMENPNLPLIRKAYYYSRQAHHGQLRESGEEYIEHPLAVALILSELGLDIISIAAALLHDVVEDTDVTMEEIEDVFGCEIALLVQGVTKLTRISFKSREERQAENLRKMFLAMAQDIRVILIKLADRLHNMRTLEYLSSKRREAKALETLEIYAPLAHRLGISRLKCELEDLSFFHLEKEKYNELSRNLKTSQEKRAQHIRIAIKKIHDRLKEQNIEAEMHGRPKHHYSIYNKMVKRDKDLSEIYDLTAVRVLVHSIRECYEVLGVLHEIWKPIPGRFKDYIAMPKSNMYQSLHTTVIGPYGFPLEVQIRTYEMHKTAEFGIAAHWRYKEGHKREKEVEQKFSWLRQLLDWQQEPQDAREFMENLRVHLFEDEVFVFTPKGDVVPLPKGATPVDFAFNIHTEVGYSCVGARVDGKIVPLEFVLENGHIVEILTSKNDREPSRDWLNFVKTSRARSKINHFFKQQRKDEAVLKGRENLNKELCRHKLDLKEIESKEELMKIANRLGRASPEDLYMAIGYNKISTEQVVKKLLGRRKKSAEELLQELKSRAISPKKAHPSGVRVKGMDGLLVRLSRCCNPVPGDEITGYITRGRGVSVHRVSCSNLKSLNRDTQRKIEVEWDRVQEQSYQVELEIEALDKQALLNEMTTVISEARLNITSIHARTSQDHSAQINVSLEISSLAQMQDIMRKLNSIDGIISVERAFTS